MAFLSAVIDIELSSDVDIQREWVVWVKPSKLRCTIIVFTKYVRSIWLMYSCGTMGHSNKKNAKYSSRHLIMNNVPF